MAYKNNSSKVWTAIFAVLLVLVFAGSAALVGVLSDGFKNWDKFNSVEEDPSVNKTYSIYNGGFETGDLTGWVLSRADDSGGDIGVVTAQSTYWQNTALPTTPYGKEGTFLFSFWTWDGDEISGRENNREVNTGTLVSSPFTLKAGAIVSFLFGGGGGNENVYLEFVDFETGEILAKFFNTLAEDAQLIKYYYVFDGLTEETECFVRVVDNAVSGWGCFTLDDVKVNCAEVPTGFHEVVNCQE